MSVFNKIVDATAGDFEKFVVRHPLLAMVHSGTAGVSLYAAYLTELFHFVRHTSRALALAASRLDDKDRVFREWLLEQALDEHGHELLCLKDLKTLGYSDTECMASRPGPGVWGLVSQNYFMASHGSQIGLLGVASATEGLGAGMAEGIARMLVERCGIHKDAVSFLRSHSGFDQGHYAQAQRVINSMGAPDEISDIINARKMTLRYYGQMLSDVLDAAGGDPIAKAA